MGAIIRMDSKKFINDFITEVDQKDFQYILISDDITNDGRCDNVKAIKRLMPPPNVLREFVEGNKKGYKKAYMNYLQDPNVEAFIAIIVKAAILNDMKMVLICSMSEDEFSYIKYLCEYIDATFKMKTYSWKEYSKDPDKASKVKNKDEVSKILGKKFERMEKTGVDLSTSTDKDKYIKEFKKLGKKGMKKFAKSKNIKLSEDLSKDEMAKKLVKKLLA
jgi:hypothetical protein